MLRKKDSVIEAAEYLKQAVFNAFKNSKKLPWPPIADNLTIFHRYHQSSEIFWNM